MYLDVPCRDRVCRQEKNRIRAPLGFIKDINRKILPKVAFVSAVSQATRRTKVERETRPRKATGNAMNVRIYQRKS